MFPEGGFGGIWCAIDLTVCWFIAIFIPIVRGRLVHRWIRRVAPFGKYYTIPPLASVPYDLDFTSCYDFRRDVLETVDDAVDFPLQQ